MTHEEEADKAKLDKNTKERYVKYMKERWDDSEEVKCLCGYVEEWAYRFKDKIEYQVSDNIGKAILMKVDEERKKL